MACLKPFGHADCVDPPVGRYSVVSAAKAGLSKLGDDEMKRMLLLLTNGLIVVFCINLDATLDLNIVYDLMIGMNILKINN